MVVPISNKSTLAIKVGATYEVSVCNIEAFNKEELAWSTDKQLWIIKTVIPPRN